MKTKIRKPNLIRHKAVLDKAVENGGSISRAMREVDPPYSEAYAHNPHKLVATKTFQALMDELLPDKEIGATLKKIMTAPRLVRKFVKGELEYEQEETDPSQIKAVDVAFKVKGRYPKEIETPTFSLPHLSNEQIAQLAELASDYSRAKKRRLEQI